MSVDLKRQRGWKLVVGLGRRKDWRSRVDLLRQRRGMVWLHRMPMAHRMQGSLSVVCSAQLWRRVRVCYPKHRLDQIVRRLSAYHRMLMVGRAAMAAMIDRMAK